MVGYNDYTIWHQDIYKKVDSVWTKLYTEAGDFASVLVPISKYGSGARSSSYNLRVDYGLGYSDQVLSFYWQHPMKTRNDFYLLNYRDMLMGLEYKTRLPQLISNWVIEYLFTKQQTDGYKSNYYNQGTLPQGSSYFGRALGNPLLLSPEYNSDGYLGFRSNRIFALHTGISGSFSDRFQYRLMATYADSKGTYKTPYTKLRKGEALLYNLSYIVPKVTGLKVTGSVAYNNGAYFGANALSGAIGLSFSGKMF